VGLRKFFKNSYLAVIILSLFLILGFFVGAEKVMASYGSSIYKFFYYGIHGILPLPQPPPEFVPYEVVKIALPDSIGSYSFAEGSFVNYVIRVKSNISTSKYKSFSESFNKEIDPPYFFRQTYPERRSDIAEFTWLQNPNVGKAGDYNCKEISGCVGTYTSKGEPKEMTVETVDTETTSLVLGPSGGKISFDYMIYNLILTIQILNEDGQLVYSNQIDPKSTSDVEWSSVSRKDTWKRLDIEIPGDNKEKKLKIVFSLKKRESYLLNYYFFLDNFSFNPYDDGNSLVGNIEDILPTVGSVRAMDFLPNFYPSQEKDSNGNTVYKELENLYKSKWIIAAEDLKIQDIQKNPTYIWTTFKLCNDYYSHFVNKESYNGYPVPVSSQLEKVATSDKNAPCIDFHWDLKNIINFKNLQIPSSDTKKVLYIFYSLKVI